MFCCGLSEKQEKLNKSLTKVCHICHWGVLSGTLAIPLQKQSAFEEDMKPIKRRRQGRLVEGRVSEPPFPIRDGAIWNCPNLHTRLWRCYLGPHLSLLHKRAQVSPRQSQCLHITARFQRQHLLSVQRFKLFCGVRLSVVFWRTDSSSMPSPALHPIVGRSTGPAASSDRAASALDSHQDRSTVLARGGTLCICTI